MSDGKSLINIDFEGLSRPATVLINRVSDAVGGIFRPAQIKRVAKAKAEASKTRALTNIEITELEERALQRLAREEAKRQENIESITAQAIEHLGDDAKPEDIDEDWLTNFFEKCRIVSDEEMQSLWAKLLAGEATNPGTYTKRTVSLVSNLDKTDAQLFTKLCAFGWQLGRHMSLLIFNYRHKVYKRVGIRFIDLTNLESIGLIRFNPSESFIIQERPKDLSINYYGQPLNITLPKDADNELEVGQAMLTNVGFELAPICGSEGSAEFFEYVIEKWCQDGLLPHSPLPEQK